MDGAMTSDEGAIVRAQNDALQFVSENITRELICCDEFELGKDNPDHVIVHSICYWAGAARALVLEQIVPDPAECKHYVVVSYCQDCGVQIEGMR